MITIMGATGHTGRAIAGILPYVQFPYPDFAQSLQQMGLSASLAQDYAEMARGFNEGRVRPTQPRGEQTTTPTRFEDFAEELATAYRRM